MIDDGSTDSTAALVQQFPSVRYCWQENSGAPVARNRGVELATGEFLAFLDSDDRWMPDKLAQQVAAFASEPSLDIVFGHVQQFYSSELDEAARQKISIPVEVMPGYHVGTMLIARAAFDRVGFFETHLRIGDFIAWHLRAVDLGLKMLMLPEIVMQRRLHETNLGIAQKQARSEYAKVIKAMLDRRRAKETK